MSSVKVQLNKSRVLKDGKYPLVFQIIHRRLKKVIYSPYHLYEVNFDSKKEIAVNRRSRRLANAEDINHYIRDQVQHIQKAIAMLENREKPFSVTDIVDFYNNQLDHSLVSCYMKRLILQLKAEGRISTMNAYQSTLNKILAFHGRENDLYFASIDVRWLDQFVSTLKREKSSQNTIAFYLRIIRAVYNRAWEEGILGVADISPFRSVHIKVAKTTKRAIDVESLQKIARVETYSKKLELSRDVFLFSFYCRGIPFIDIAYLSWNNICGREIRYIRRKTNQPLCVRITEPMGLLIEKYRSSSTYIFPILSEERGDLYLQYRSALKVHNRNLKEIGLRLNIPTPLTSYVARHSWATMAKRNGVPVSVISEGLGHSSEKITYTYLAALDSSVIDDANDLISNLCLGDSRQPAH